MTQEQWLNELKHQQSNREGLGMYVLDTFNEDIAESLAEHDRELEDNIINKVVELLSEVGLDDKTVDMLKEKRYK